MFALVEGLFFSHSCCSQTPSSDLLLKTVKRQSSKPGSLGQEIKHHVSVLVSPTLTFQDRELEFTLKEKITETTQDIPARTEDPFTLGCCCLFQVPVELCGTAHCCLPSPQEDHKLCSLLFRQKSLEQLTAAGRQCIFSTYLYCYLNCAFFEKLERNSP